jgi:hypothetical protein
MSIPIPVLPYLTTGYSYPTYLPVLQGMTFERCSRRLGRLNLSTAIRTLYVYFYLLKVVFADGWETQSGNPKGTAYVQFKDLRSAQMALDAMAGFELAGRTSESAWPLFPCSALIYVFVLVRVQTIQERPQVVDQVEDLGQGYGPRMDNTQRQQLMFKLARTEPNVNLSLSANRSSSTP